MDPEGTFILWPVSGLLAFLPLMSLDPQMLHSMSVLETGLPQFLQWGMSKLPYSQ
jgi:hypothetical protein